MVDLLEIMIGGSLLMLFFVAVASIPPRLENLTIRVIERVRPGWWCKYKRSTDSLPRDREPLILLCTAIIFGAGAWCGLIAYSFLLSLALSPLR